MEAVGFALRQQCGGVLSYLSIDLCYTHIFVDDVAADLSVGATSTASRGDLSSDYESAIDIFSMLGRLASQPGPERTVPRGTQPGRN